MRRPHPLTTAPGFLIFVTLTLVIGCRGEESLPTQAEVLEALEQGRIEEAIEGYGALVQENPDDYDLQLAYGSVLASSGAASRAIFPLSRALESPDHAVSAGLFLARLQINLRDANDALTTLDRVTEIEPDNETAQGLRIEALLVEKRFDDVLVLVDERLTETPDDLDLVLHRFRALLSLERVDEAMEAMSRMQVLAPAEGDANANVATHLCVGGAVFAKERGDREIAETLFEQCLKASDEAGRYPALVSHAAQFYDEQQDFERATEIWRDAFESDPSMLEARVSYAYRLRAVGRADEADALVRDATEESPSAWLALADMYVADERFADAAEAMRGALDAAPESNELWRFMLADHQVLAGDLAGAEDTLRTLENPTYSFFIEGRLLFARQRYAEAYETLLEAVRTWPNNGGYRHLAGLAADRMGDYDAAVDQLKEAARIDPPPLDATLLFVELMISRGEIGAAHAALSRLLQEHATNPKVAMARVRAAARAPKGDGGQRALRMLSQIPGQGPRAIAESIRLSAIRGGAAAALDSVEKTNFDLTIPPVFDALAALSRTLARAGHTQDALDRIDAALAREDALPAARALRGEILAIAGRNEEALVETARARKLASGDAADAIVLTLSARTARLTGHATEALAFARAASDAAPDSVDVVTELALAELATGATSAARYVLNAALDNDPHNARLARTYAEVLLATPDTPAPDLRRAGRRARLFGDDQAAVLVHGRCLLAAGEVAQARDALQRARSLVGPDSARAAYYAGLALEKLGTTEEAAEAFAEAVAAGGFAELADATRRRDRLQRSGT